MKTKEIVEKKLGISADYQYWAMRKSFWLKKNWHRNKFTVVKALSGFKNSMDVLDLGTGSGNLELLFADSVKHIYGIDYNDEALLFLKNKLVSNKIKNVSLDCCDMRDIPAKLAKKKYDLIVSVDTIEHITAKDGGSVISWSKERLTKSGKLIIITPNYHSVWILLEPLLDLLSLTPVMGKHQHLSKYSIENISGVLAKKGFRIKTTTSFNLFSFLFPESINRHLVKFEMRFLKNWGPLMAIVATRE